MLAVGAVHHHLLRCGLRAQVSIVLESGELKEIGSHDELLARGGRYAELFHLQAQGYR